MSSTGYGNAACSELCLDMERELCTFLGLCLFTVLECILLLFSPWSRLSASLVFIALISALSQ